MCGGLLFNKCFKNQRQFLELISGGAKILGSFQVLLDNLLGHASFPVQALLEVL